MIINQNSKISTKIDVFNISWYTEYFGIVGIDKISFLREATKMGNKRLFLVEKKFSVAFFCAKHDIHNHTSKGLAIV